MAAAVAAAALVSSAAAFSSKDGDEKFDLDAAFAALPPQSTKPSSSGRGFSSTFIETSSAETVCESNADSAFFSDFKNAYISAGASSPPPPPP